MQKGNTEESEFLAIVGNRIRWLRKTEEITQTKLAVTCRFAKASLNRIEKGKTNLTILTARRVAAALEIPLSRIFISGD